MRSKSIYRRMFLTASILFVFCLALTSVTYAGTAMSAQPVFPTTVSVGDQDLNVALLVKNNSGADAPFVRMDRAYLSGMYCTTDTNPVCILPDTNTVFSKPTTATGGGICTGITFSVVDSGSCSNAPAAPCITNGDCPAGGTCTIYAGNIAFQPNDDVYLPIFSGNVADQCNIVFQVDVLNAPHTDAVPGGSKQTIQLGMTKGVAFGACLPNDADIVCGSGLPDCPVGDTCTGDSAGLPASGTGTDITTVLPCNPPMETLSSETGQVIPGTAVSDSVTVTGNCGPTPTGDVDFYLCGPTVSATPCIAGGTSVSSNVALSGGEATSGTTAPTAPGFYCWRAEYSGDDNYNPSNHTSITNECFEVIECTPEMSTLSSQTGLIQPGTAVSDTATVTGNCGTPTGNVDFYLCGPTVSATPCTAGGTSVSSNVVLSGGSATSGTTAPTAPGFYCWRAEYSGDSLYDPVTHTSITNECFEVKEVIAGECRMTGGHVKFLDDTCVTVETSDGVGMLSVTPVTIKKNNSLATRQQTVKYTVGGQIGAPQAGCCDTPPDSPGRDENCPGGSWQHTHHQGLVSWTEGGVSDFSGGFGFHSGTASAPVDAYIKCINCSDPGWCTSARCAPFKQIFWEGTGVFHNIDPASKFQSCATIVPDDKKSNKPPTIHYYQAHVGDFGEGSGCTDQQEPLAGCPWRSGGVDSSPDIGSSPDPKFGDRGGEICVECADWYEIEIHCTAEPNSPIIYRVGNFMTHGNYQIHPQVGQNCFDTYPQR